MRPAADIGLDLAALRDVTWKEIGVRFLFGCGISLAAALVSLRFGPRWGGLFLAFPAILPASLTLIEDKQGGHAAMVDAVGAIMGGVALAVFAAAAATLVPALPAGLALAAATLGWLVAAVGLYLLAARLLAAHGRRPQEPDRPHSSRRRTKTA